MQKKEDFFAGFSEKERAYMWLTAYRNTYATPDGEICIPLTDPVFPNLRDDDEFDDYIPYEPEFLCRWLVNHYVPYLQEYGTNTSDTSKLSKIFRNFAENDIEMHLVPLSEEKAEIGKRCWEEAIAMALAELSDAA